MTKILKKKLLQTCKNQVTLKFINNRETISQIALYFYSNFYQQVNNSPCFKAAPQLSYTPINTHQLAQQSINTSKFLDTVDQYSIRLRNHTY